MRPGGFRGVFERRDTMIFDTHAHYTSRRFDGHRDEVLDSLPAQGVCGVVECGVDLATSRAALALAETRPWVWAAAGIPAFISTLTRTSAHPVTLRSNITISPRAAVR